MHLGALHKLFLAGVFLALFAFQTTAHAEGSEIVQAAAIAAQAAGAIGKAGIEAGAAIKKTAMNNANDQMTLTKTLANQLAQLKDGALLNKLRAQLSERIDKRQTASDLNKFTATSAANLSLITMQAGMQTMQRQYDYSMKNLMFEFQAAFAAKQRKIQELVATLTAQASSNGKVLPTRDVDSGARLPIRAVAAVASNALVTSANSGQGFARTRGAAPGGLAFNPIATGSTSRSMNRGSALAQFQQTMGGRTRGVRSDEGIPHRSLASIESGSSHAGSDRLSTHGIRSFSDAD
jgi:hypothetical protein